MKERKPTARELHEQQAKDLWMKVAIAVATSSNATSHTSMNKWADHAVAEFDKRFHPDNQ